MMIFVPTVKVGERVKELFLEKNHTIPFYHSKLDKLKRDNLLNRFIGTHEPPIDAIICTNAFGMGIDIPNVRCVVHWQYPASIEDYAQEYGRAGRDGQQAAALLFYRYENSSANDDDYKIQEYMIKLTLNNVIPKLDESAYLNEYRYQMKKLEEMKRFTESKECLRKQIQDYFNNEKSEKKIDLTRIILNFIFTKRSNEKKDYSCCSFCNESQLEYLINYKFKKESNEVNQ